MPPRLHLARLFGAGEVLTLPPASSRHLQVLRLQPGSGVSLFNGEDGLEWSAEVVRMGRSDVELRVLASHAVNRELPIAVTLAPGIPANERMDTLVEKATELGAGAIQPLLCERSVVRLAGERAEARRRHWHAVAAAASEQCGRVRVPEIGAPMKLEAWLQGLDAETPRASSGSDRWVLSLAAEALRLDALPVPMPSSPAPRLIVLSGPEGGLTPAEEARAVAVGFVRVTLGPRVLRAETAPLAMLAWLALSSLRTPP